jgi:translocation and assembly module TamB
MRALRILLRVVGAILAFVVVTVIVVTFVVAVGVNTPFGHRSLEKVAKLAGVEIAGLDGHFPDDVTVDRIAMADAKGMWLEIEGVRLSWWPTALIHKEAKVGLLAARRIHVIRYPEGGAASQPSASSATPNYKFGWRLQVDRIQLDRIELPEATLSAEGRAIYQDDGMDVSLTASTPDAAGQGPAKLQASLVGPLDKVKAALTIDAKGLTTRADGNVDLLAVSGDLHLGIDQPAFGGASAARIAADVKGNADSATVHAVVDGVKIPGSQPDLLGDGPVTLDATYSQAATPNVTAKLSGGARAPEGLKIAADAALTLATKMMRVNLAVDRLVTPSASVSRVTLLAEGTADNLDAHGEISGLAAPGVQPAMLGSAPLKLDVKLRRQEAQALSVSLTGDTVALTASGALPTERLGLDYHVVLPNLAAFAPNVAGHADLAGRIEGAFDDFAVRTHADAQLSAQGVSSPIVGDIEASGLPSAPQGRVVVKGAYGGQPVLLDVKAVTGADRLARIDIAEASWQGVVAKGGFTLAADGGLPTGSVDIAAKTLPAPARNGAAKANIALVREGVTPVLKVLAEVTNAAIEGASLSKVTLSGRVTDPVGATPVLDASLMVDGLASGKYRQSARLDVAGPQNALALKLAVTGTAGLTAAATVDAPGNTVRIASLRGTLQGQELRLAAPTTIVYAPQISLGATRLTLGGSSLDIAGKLSPALDLTASLKAVPAELARIADPSLQAEGVLNVQARVQGSMARPTGTVRVSGSGLRLRQPRGMPALALEATSNLQGEAARVDARVSSGTTAFTLTGSVPVRPGGNYDLAARGRADLALLDPFLAASGAQLRGLLELNATVTGREPTPAGTLVLHRGEISAPEQGARLSQIELLVRARPDRVVIESLSAKAGPGTLSGSGSVDLTGPMGIDVRLSARGASPVASDLLTAKFDADFSLTGAVKTGMAAAGTIRIARAEINIPQKLPSSLPVLNVRQPGPPPPPPAPEVPISLDINLVAPGQVFVRGRGLDAELGGSLHVGGTVSAPKPEGGFALRRGQFSLAGQNINFTTGKVFLDGQLPIDPSLDFSATVLGTNVAATVSVTGNASAPKIRLSSVPELPQDEILAQLLFRRKASDLGPLQLAQIAAALAQIADVGGSSGFDPLGAARKSVGLDVLSVGGAPGATRVEAGRNIARGVYLGAKQSATGSGSQATVRVDLATGLRLEADLGVAPSPAANATPGAPPTGNQVGVTYEFEY